MSLVEKNIQTTNANKRSTTKFNNIQDDRHFKTFNNIQNNNNINNKSNPVNVNLSTPNDASPKVACYDIYLPEMWLRTDLNKLWNIYESSPLRYLSIK